MTTADSAKRLGHLKAMQAKFHARQADRSLASDEDGSPRAPLLQKLLQHISDDDGNIDPKKARMFLTYVKKQIADPKAPRHDMAKRIAEKLQKIPEAQRRKVLAAAGISEDANFDFTGPTGPTGPEGGDRGDTSRRGLLGDSGDTKRTAGRAAQPKPQDHSAESWVDDLFDNL